MSGTAGVAFLGRARTSNRRGFPIGLAWSAKKLTAVYPLVACWLNLLGIWLGQCELLLSTRAVPGRLNATPGPKAYAALDSTALRAIVKCRGAVGQLTLGRLFNAGRP